MEKRDGWKGKGKGGTGESTSGGNICNLGKMEWKST